MKCSSRILFLIRPNVFVSFIRPGLQGIRSSAEKSVYIPVVFIVLIITRRKAWKKKHLNYGVIRC